MHKERFARSAEIFYKEMWRLVKKEYKNSDIQEVGSSYKAVYLCFVFLVFFLLFFVLLENYLLIGDDTIAGGRVET